MWRDGGLMMLGRASKLGLAQTIDLSYRVYLRPTALPV